MPIYSYRCQACETFHDILQKVSDPIPSCPNCHRSTLSKQVTAAGFQLKGSGYYVTDFRNPPSHGKSASDNDSSDTKANDKNTNDKGQPQIPSESKNSISVEKSTTNETKSNIDQTKVASSSSIAAPPTN